MDESVKNRHMYVFKRQKRCVVMRTGYPFGDNDRIKMRAPRAMTTIVEENLNTQLRDVNQNVLKLLGAAGRQVARCRCNDTSPAPSATNSNVSTTTTVSDPSATSHDIESLTFCSSRKSRSFHFTTSKQSSVETDGDQPKIGPNKRKMRHTMLTKTSRSNSDITHQKFAAYPVHVEMPVFLHKGKSGSSSSLISQRRNEIKYRQPSILSGLLRRALSSRNNKTKNTLRDDQIDLTSPNTNPGQHDATKNQTKCGRDCIMDATAKQEKARRIKDFKSKLRERQEEKKYRNFSPSSSMEEEIHENRREKPPKQRFAKKRSEGKDKDKYGKSKLPHKPYNKDKHVHNMKTQVCDKNLQLRNSESTNQLKCMFLMAPPKKRNNHTNCGDSTNPGKTLKREVQNTEESKNVDLLGFKGKSKKRKVHDDDHQGEYDERKKAKRESSLVRIKQSLLQLAGFSKLGERKRSKSKQRDKREDNSQSRTPFREPTRHVTKLKAHNLQVYTVSMKVTGTSRMQRFLEQDNADLNKLRSCELVVPYMKATPTITRAELGSLEIPPYKPKNKTGETRRRHHKHHKNNRKVRVDIGTMPCDDVCPVSSIKLQTKEPIVAKNDWMQETNLNSLSDSNKLQLEGLTFDTYDTYEHIQICDHISATSLGDDSNLMVISKVESTKENSIILRNFEEANPFFESSERNRRLNGVVDSLYATSTFHTYPPLLMDPYCYMTLNTAFNKRRTKNKSTNTDLVWTDLLIDYFCHAIHRAKLDIEQESAFRKTAFKRSAYNKHTFGRGRRSERRLQKDIDYTRNTDHSDMFYYTKKHGHKSKIPVCLTDKRIYPFPTYNCFEDSSFDDKSDKQDTKTSQIPHASLNRTENDTSELNYLQSNSEPGLDFESVFFEALRKSKDIVNLEEEMIGAYWDDSEIILDDTVVEKIKEEDELRFFNVLDMEQPKHELSTGKSTAKIASKFTEQEQNICDDSRRGPFLFEIRSDQDKCIPKSIESGKFAQQRCTPDDLPQKTPSVITFDGLSAETNLGMNILGSKEENGPTQKTDLPLPTDINIDLVGAPVNVTTADLIQPSNSTTFIVNLTDLEKAHINALHCNSKEGLEKTDGLRKFGSKISIEDTIRQVGNGEMHSVSLQVLVPSRNVDTNTSLSKLPKYSTQKKTFWKSRLPLPINRSKRMVKNSYTFPIKIDLAKIGLVENSGSNVSSRRVLWRAGKCAARFQVADNFSVYGQIVNYINFSDKLDMSCTDGGESSRGGSNWFSLRWWSLFYKKSVKISLNMTLHLSDFAEEFTTPSIYTYKMKTMSMLKRSSSLVLLPSSKSNNVAAVLRSLSLRCIRFTISSSDKIWKIREAISVKLVPNEIDPSKIGENVVAVTDYQGSSQQLRMTSSATKSKGMLPGYKIKKQCLKLMCLRKRVKPAQTPKVITDVLLPSEHDEHEFDAIRKHFCLVQPEMLLDLNHKDKENVQKESLEYEARINERETLAVLEEDQRQTEKQIKFLNQEAELYRDGYENIYTSVTRCDYGMAYLNFKSVLRKYLSQADALLTPCVKGQMQKSTTEVLPEEVQLILVQIGSQTCEKHVTTLVEGYIFSDFEANIANTGDKSEVDLKFNRIVAQEKFCFEIYPEIGTDDYELELGSDAEFLPMDRVLESLESSRIDASYCGSDKSLAEENFTMTIDKKPDYQGIHVVFKEEQFEIFINDIMGAILKYEDICIFDAVKIKALELKYRYVCVSEVGDYLHNDGLDTITDESKPSYYSQTQTIIKDKNMSVSIIADRLDDVSKNQKEKEQRELAQQGFGLVYYRKTSFTNHVSVHSSSSCTSLDKLSKAVNSLKPIKSSKSYPCLSEIKNLREHRNQEVGVWCKIDMAQGDARLDNLACLCRKPLDCKLRLDKEIQKRTKPDCPAIDLERFYTSTEFVSAPIVRYFYSCDQVIVRHQPILWVLAKKFVTRAKPSNCPGIMCSEQHSRNNSPKFETRSVSAHRSRKRSCSADTSKSGSCCPKKKKSCKKKKRRTKDANLNVVTCVPSSSSTACCNQRGHRKSRRRRRHLSDDAIVDHSRHRHNDTRKNSPSNNTNTCEPCKRAARKKSKCCFKKRGCKKRKKLQAEVMTCAYTSNSAIQFRVQCIEAQQKVITRSSCSTSTSSDFGNQMLVTRDSNSPEADPKPTPRSHSEPAIRRMGPILGTTSNESVTQCSSSCSSVYDETDLQERACGPSCLRLDATTSMSEEGGKLLMKKQSVGNNDLDHSQNKVSDDGLGDRRLTISCTKAGKICHAEMKNNELKRTYPATTSEETPASSKQTTGPLTGPCGFERVIQDDTSNSLHNSETKQKTKIFDEDSVLVVRVLSAEPLTDLNQFELAEAQLISLEKVEVIQDEQNTAAHPVTTQTTINEPQPMVSMTVLTEETIMLDQELATNSFTSSEVQTLLSFKPTNSKRSSWLRKLMKFHKTKNEATTSLGTSFSSFENVLPGAAQTSITLLPTLSFPHALFGGRHLNRTRNCDCRRPNEKKLTDLLPAHNIKTSTDSSLFHISTHTPPLLTSVNDITDQPSHLTPVAQEEPIHINSNDKVPKRSSAISVDLSARSESLSGDGFIVHKITEHPPMYIKIKTGTPNLEKILAQAKKEKEGKIKVYRTPDEQERSSINGMDTVVRLTAHTLGSIDSKDMTPSIMREAAVLEMESELFVKNDCCKPINTNSSRDGSNKETERMNPNKLVKNEERNTNNVRLITVEEIPDSMKYSFFPLNNLDTLYLHAHYVQTDYDLYMQSVKNNSMANYYAESFNSGKNMSIRSSVPTVHRLKSAEISDENILIDTTRQHPLTAKVAETTSCVIDDPVLGFHSISKNVQVTEAGITRTAVSDLKERIVAPDGHLKLTHQEHFHIDDNGLVSYKNKLKEAGTDPETGSTIRTATKAVAHGHKSTETSEETTIDVSGAKTYRNTKAFADTGVTKFEEHVIETAPNHSGKKSTKTIIITDMDTGKRFEKVESKVNDSKTCSVMKSSKTFKDENDLIEEHHEMKQTNVPKASKVLHTISDLLHRRQKEDPTLAFQNLEESKKHDANAVDVGVMTSDLPKETSRYVDEAISYSLVNQDAHVSKKSNLKHSTAYDEQSAQVTLVKQDAKCIQFPEVAQLFEIRDNDGKGVQYELPLARSSRSSDTSQQFIPYSVSQVILSNEAGNDVPSTTSSSRLQATNTDAQYAGSKRKLQEDESTPTTTTKKSKDEATSCCKFQNAPPTGVQATHVHSGVQKKCCKRKVDEGVVTNSLVQESDYITPNTRNAHNCCNTKTKSHAKLLLPADSPPTKTETMETESVATNSTSGIATEKRSRIPTASNRRYGGPGMRNAQTCCNSRSHFSGKSLSSTRRPTSSKREATETEMFVTNSLLRNQKSCCQQKQADKQVSVRSDPEVIDASITTDEYVLKMKDQGVSPVFLIPSKIAKECCKPPLTGFEYLPETEFVEPTQTPKWTNKKKIDSKRKFPCAQTCKKKKIKSWMFRDCCNEKIKSTSREFQDICCLPKRETKTKCGSYACSPKKTKCKNHLSCSSVKIYGWRGCYKKPKKSPKYIFNDCCDTDVINDFFKLGSNKFTKRYPECCWPRIISRSSDQVVDTYYDMRQSSTSKPIESKMEPVVVKAPKLTKRLEYVFNDCCDEDTIDLFRKLGLQKFKKKFPECCWPKTIETDVAHLSKEMLGPKTDESHNKSPVTSELMTKCEYILKDCCGVDEKALLAKLGFEEFAKLYPHCCVSEKVAKVEEQKSVITKTCSAGYETTKKTCKKCCSKCSKKKITDSKKSVLVAAEKTCKKCCSKCNKKNLPDHKQTVVVTEDPEEISSRVQPILEHQVSGCCNEVMKDDNVSFGKEVPACCNEYAKKLLDESDDKTIPAVIQKLSVPEKKNILSEKPNSAMVDSSSIISNASNDCKGLISKGSPIIRSMKPAIVPPAPASSLMSLSQNEQKLGLQINHPKKISVVSNQPPLRLSVPHANIVRQQTHSLGENTADDAPIIVVDQKEVGFPLEASPNKLIRMSKTLNKYNTDTSGPGTSPKKYGAYQTNEAQLSEVSKYNNADLEHQLVVNDKYYPASSQNLKRDEPCACKRKQRHAGELTNLKPDYCLCHPEVKKNPVKFKCLCKKNLVNAIKEQLCTDNHGKCLCKKQGKSTPQSKVRRDSLTFTAIGMDQVSAKLNQIDSRYSLLEQIDKYFLPKSLSEPNLQISEDNRYLFNGYPKCPIGHLNLKHFLPGFSNEPEKKPKPILKYPLLKKHSAHEKWSHTMAKVYDQQVMSIHSKIQIRDDGESRFVIDPEDRYKSIDFTDVPNRRHKSSLPQDEKNIKFLEEIELIDIKRPRKRKQTLDEKASPDPDVIPSGGSMNIKSIDEGNEILSGQSLEKRRTDTKSIELKAVDSRNVSPDESALISPNASVPTFIDFTPRPSDTSPQSQLTPQPITIFDPPPATPPPRSSSPSSRSSSLSSRSSSPLLLAPTLSSSSWEVIKEFEQESPSPVRKSLSQNFISIPESEMESEPEYSTNSLPTHKKNKTVLEWVISKLFEIDRTPKKEKSKSRPKIIAKLFGEPKCKVISPKSHTSTKTFSCGCCQAKSTLCICDGHVRHACHCKQKKKVEDQVVDYSFVDKINFNPQINLSLTNINQTSYMSIFEMSGVNDYGNALDESCSNIDDLLEGDQFVVNSKWRLDAGLNKVMVDVSTSECERLSTIVERTEYDHERGTSTTAEGAAKKDGQEVINPCKRHHRGLLSACGSVPPIPSKQFNTSSQKPIYVCSTTDLTDIVQLERKNSKVGRLMKKVKCSLSKLRKRRDAYTSLAETTTHPGHFLSPVRCTQTSKTELKTLIHMNDWRKKDSDIGSANSTSKMDKWRFQHTNDTPISSLKSNESPQHLDFANIVDLRKTNPKVNDIKELIRHNNLEQIYKLEEEIKLLNQQIVLTYQDNDVSVLLEATLKLKKHLKETLCEETQLRSLTSLNKPDVPEKEVAGTAGPQNEWKQSRLQKVKDPALNVDNCTSCISIENRESNSHVKKDAKVAEESQIEMLIFRESILRERERIRKEDVIRRKQAISEALKSSTSSPKKKLSADWSTTADTCAFFGGHTSGNCIMCDSTTKDSISKNLESKLSKPTHLLVQNINSDSATLLRNITDEAEILGTYVPDSLPIYPVMVSSTVAQQQSTSSCGHCEKMNPSCDEVLFRSHNYKAYDSSSNASIVSTASKQLRDKAHEALHKAQRREEAKKLHSFIENECSKEVNLAMHPTPTVNKVIIPAILKKKANAMSEPYTNRQSQQEVHIDKVGFESPEPYLLLNSVANLKEEVALNSSTHCKRSHEKVRFRLKFEAPHTDEPGSKLPNQSYVLEKLSNISYSSNEKEYILDAHDYCNHTSKNNHLCSSQQKIVSCPSKKLPVHGAYSKKPSILTSGNTHWPKRYHVNNLDVECYSGYDLRIAHRQVTGSEPGTVQQRYAS